MVEEKEDVQSEDEDVEAEAKERERRRHKNKKKKLSKKRKNKKTQNEEGRGEKGTMDVDSGMEETGEDDDLEVELDYVGGDIELSQSDPNYQYFSQVFQTFKIGSENVSEGENINIPRYREVKREEETPSKDALTEKILQEEMSEKRRELEDAGAIAKLSKRKLRLQRQPTIAELKELTPRPDVVEWHDVTSRDPKLLVTLKAYRNTVPVPRHWNAKRKYLAGKRGFERLPFELPDFIKRTGIMEMRETMWEKEDHQTLKSKMRERMRPKLGRIDIDYQKLHDAFFKWQTKPTMSRMGDLYFEGKELETQMREKKPGELTDDIRIALGMPVGPNANRFPPPWLIAMQRYGPPPSYPNLKIPGLNCSIPEGCAFGYHGGGWGKPPVDEYGKPLYGDVFGLEVPTLPEMEDESRIERKHWGEMESDEELSSEDEDEEPAPPAGGGQPAPPTDRSGFATPAGTEGFITPSGISSGMPTGLETPDAIELRKRKIVESSTGDTPAALYTVVPERKVERIAGQMMASSHVYDMSKKAPVVESGGVEVSLNPEDLDLGDQKGLEKKYEEQLRKQTKSRDDDEDFSDMVAEHSAKQNRKRKAQEQKKSNVQQKKYKDFKF